MLLTVGFLLVLVAIGLVALTATGRVPAATAALGWTVAGLGMGLGLTSLSVLVLELSEPREQGANAASLQVSDGLGSILLIGAAGAIFAAYAGSATDPTGAGDVGATPYLVIDLVMAVVCLAGALVGAPGGAGGRHAIARPDLISELHPTVRMSSDATWLASPDR